MTTILTHDEIRSTAPAAFATDESVKMSERYNFVNTASILEKLESNGFFPVQAVQDKPRQRDPMTVRHSIILRPEEYDIAEGEVAPQILLVNSHNGRTKLRLFAGFYRFICCNGLVVGDDKFTLEIGHAERIAGNIEQYIDGFGTQVGDLNSRMRRWSQINLSEMDMVAFAREAAEIRFGSQMKSAFELSDILEARRTEDEGSTLWQVYNRVQENATKGGIHGKTASGRATTSRALTAIGADIDFNRNLWALAERVAEAA